MFRYPYLLALLCLLGSQGLFSQQIGLSMPADSTKVSLRLDVHNGLMTVPVLVNGKAMLRFILDTSTDHTTVVSKQVGEDLGFNFLRQFALGQSPEGPLLGYSVNGLNYELAGTGVMTGDNHNIMVLEYDFLGLTTMARVPIHGLLGRDLFGRYVVEVDLDKQVMTIHKPEGFVVPSGYQALDLKVEGNKPFVKIQSVFENWDETDTYFELKTGAPHTILFDSPDNIFHMPPKKVETILGRGSSGDLMGYVGRVRQVSLDKFVISEPIASFTGAQIKGTDRSSVGMGLLGRFHLIFDMPGGKLYLKPNRSFTQTFEYDLSGITIEPVAEDKFVVTRVQDGSPAQQAGLRIGDAVLAIDGTALTMDNFAALTSVFSSKPDKKITLRIAQGDVQKEISFKLVRFI